MNKTARVLTKYGVEKTMQEIARLRKLSSNPTRERQIKALERTMEITETDKQMAAELTEQFNNAVEQAFQFVGLL